MLYAFDPSSPHSAAVNNGQQDALRESSHEWRERAQTGRKVPGRSSKFNGITLDHRFS
jgi:hypothetical protein